MLEIKVYEAVDGTKFNTKEACMEYETELSRKNKEDDERIAEVKKDAEKLREMVLPDDFIPLNEHYLDPDNWYFTWFKVNNDEELMLIDKYVSDTVFDLKYPTYVCVESESEFFSDDGDINGGGYIITLNSNIAEAKWFFKQFGMEIEITKEKGE